MSSQARVLRCGRCAGACQARSCGRRIESGEPASSADEHRRSRAAMSDRHRRDRRTARTPDRRRRARAAHAYARNRPDRRGVAGRRNRRHHDHQHGAAAPVDARCAAPHDGTRLRRGHPDQAGDRLPAHRHGEDGRRPHLRAGPDQRHPHGLRGAVLQRARVLDGGRTPPRHRGAAARGVDPDDVPGAQPDVVAPAVPGDERHGHRRGLDDALRLARARRSAALLREDHRACG